MPPEGPRLKPDRLTCAFSSGRSFGLPLVLDLTTRVSMSPVDVPAPKALIADDEKIIADTLAMILNQFGFDARAVYTCRNALDPTLNVASTFQPDTLISDVLMPDSNGVDAAIQMCAMLPGIRVFLLSGQTATTETIANSTACDLGFEVLEKPVRPKNVA
jgi:DNA-binding response OmpR family regulator